MKKILIFLFVLCFVVPAFGLDPSAFNSRSTFRNGYAWSGHQAKDRATLWAQQVEAAVDIGQQLGTGSVFYVDSGALGSATGLSWSDAVTTVDAAVNLCTANRGDFILVAQGHSENLSAGDDVDADVAVNQAAGLFIDDQPVHVSEITAPPQPGVPIALDYHCYTCAAGSGFT